MQPSVNSPRIRIPRFAKIVAALAILTAFGIACWLGAFSSEPTYRNQPASFYLAKGDVDAFKAMGPAGVRFLGRMWELEPSNFAPKEDAFLKSINLPQFAFFEEADNNRMQLSEAATEILNQLGREAEPALPTFLRVFRSRDSDQGKWAQSVEFMKQIGPDLGFLVPELIVDMLRAEKVAGDGKNSADTIELASERVVGDIDLLAAIGPKAKAAIPPLTHWASEIQPSDRHKQMQAAIALWNIDRRTNVLVDVVSNQLRFRDQQSWMAIASLYNAETLPKALGPVLEKTLYSPNMRVRDSAEFHLNRSDPERVERIARELNSHQPELLQRHLELLQSTNGVDRLNALRALPFFGPQAALAEPLLARLLAACIVHRPTTMNGQAGMNEQIQRLKEQHAAVRALKEIEARSPESASLLMSLFQSNPSFDADLISALSNSGRSATNALPQLQGFLHQHRGDMLGQFLAAQAICRIDPDDSEAVRILKFAETNSGDLSSYGSDIVRPSAVVALWKTGREPALPIDHLRAIVGASLHQVGPDRTWAIDLLGEIGPPACAALPELERLLNRKLYVGGVWGLRSNAALAIRKIDPDEAKRLDLPGLFIICPDKQ